MRQRSGWFVTPILNRYKACRERHIKCVKLRDSNRCKYCTERKRSCIRGNAFRFRPVKAVKFNAGEDIGSAEQSLEFSASQTWVNIPKSLQFFAPNTDGDDGVGSVEAEVQSDSNKPETASDKSTENSANAASIGRTFAADAAVTDLALSYNNLSPFSSISVPVFGENDLPSIHDVLSRTVTLDKIPPANNFQAPDLGRHDSFGRNNPFGRNDSISGVLQKTSAWPNNPRPNPQTQSSPYVFKKSPLDSVSNVSPYNSTTFPQSPSAFEPRWPVNNAYEARLFHHYIIHCTPWIDVCDPRCHFAKEVPKRAAQFPVILHGILGLAARHLWLMGKESEDYSQPWVDKCLNALIVALEDPLAHWDENFLVAVILLRLHEEMGDADEQCHHFGTARILNSISSFAADGGLRESASWVSLRQHIYVSLTSQQPLNLSLDNYRHSSVFRDFDDESWTNRAIFLFATILQTIFGENGEANTNTLTQEKWTELHAELDDWERTKPWTFAAFHIEPNAGERFNGAWPQLPCAQGVVAVGLQYYHLSKIILTIYSPNASLVGLTGVRARKATDASIRKHIRITIGYGFSNEICGNAMFQGSHILSACGAYIVDPMEQEACVEYLRGLQSRIGWRTDKVIADVREQWSA